MSSGNLPNYGHPNKCSNIAFLADNSSDSFTLYKLKEDVEYLPEASFSPILTLGAYLLYHHNDVPPPNFSSHFKTNGKVDSSYPNQELTVNGYFQPWCDYLSSLIVEGKSYQFEENLYFTDFVTESWVQSFNKSNVFEITQIEKTLIEKYQETNNYVSIVQEAFGLEKISVPKNRKMAAVCFSAKPTTEDPFLPKVHIPGLFFGLFYRQPDMWKIYRPLENQFPTEEELLELDGIILSGSAHGVYEDIPEINRFMAMLMNAYKKNDKLKILGFCFGHQSIAYALGGKVEKMPYQVVHLENIRFDYEKLRELKLDWIHEVEESDFMTGKETYKVSEFHGDAVTKIPEGFTVIASSESCSIESMVSNNGRILSFQFHMEYTPEFAKAYELRLRSYDESCHYGKIYIGSSKFESCEKNRRSIEELRFLARRFLEIGKDENN